MWNDDDHSNHQFITKNKYIIYERWKDSFKRNVGEIEIDVCLWGKWIKLEEPQQYLGKMWFVRDLSVEDIILQNYEEAEPL